MEHLVRSLERAAGAPAAPSPSLPRRRVTPARARRSQLRLEKFQKKKVEEKARAAAVVTDVATGDTSNSLVIELANTKEKHDDNIETGNVSPIMQIDGSLEDDQTAEYTFTSEYAEEDVVYTLDEIFPDKNCSLESYVQFKPKSAKHCCTVTVKDEVQLANSECGAKRCH